MDDSAPVTDTDTDGDSDSDPDPTTGPIVGHVIVMVMDGARIDETFGDGYSDAEDEETENLFLEVKERLAAYGTILKPGYNTGITITGPGHCSLLTGARQEYGHFATPDGAGYYRPELPTLYEEIRAQLGALEAELVLTGNTDHVESLSHSLYPALGSSYRASYNLVTNPEDQNDTEPAEADEQVVTAVEERLATDQPRLLLANLHAMDRAGHYNDDPDAYGKRVEQMSQPLVDLWDYIQSPESGGLADDTVLVLVADHGRHRWGEEEEARLDGTEGPDFRNHGDQCRGCREIPMLMVGPGIQEGITVTTPYTQEDVAATIARLLGVELPYASGVVIDEALADDVVIQNRSGDVSPAVADGVSVVQRYVDDGMVQSQMVLDGEVVSAADAIHAEGPVAVSLPSRDVVCWRELTLMYDSDELDWPWFGECRTRTGSNDWESLTLPDKVVGSIWRPAIAEDSAGNVMLAFADNSNSTTYWNNETPAAVKLWRWSESAGWEGTDELGAQTASLFPSAPSMVAIGETWFIAYANSDIGAAYATNPGRYTRHISIQQVSWGDQQGWTELWRNYVEACPTDADCLPTDPTLDTEGNEYGRYERPVIGAIENVLYVAYVGYGEVGNTVLLSIGAGKGSSWSNQERVDDSGRVLGHIAPIWVDSNLYWARLGTSDTVEICKMEPESTADCVDTGATRIMGLTGYGDEITVSLDQGVGQWAVQTVSW